MRIHKNCFCGVFILILNYSFAQKQANVWCFGQKVGVDFNSGTPMDVSPGTMITQEGSASIADKNGNLLFYTDGITVYDKNHQPMPNGLGLKGHSSSTQSAIITPDVCNSCREEKFYIFTIRGFSSQHLGKPEFHYSIVDMKLPGNGTLVNPKGDVVQISKNTFLTDSTGEKITAVKHADLVSYWIIIAKYYANTFYAYHVTCDGVSSEPVVSAFNYAVNNESGMGYMKASADGKTIVVGMAQNTSLGAPGLMKFDFDNATGKLSNPVKMSSTPIYGVEFSSNDSLIYGSSYDFSQTNVKIFQYQRFSNNIQGTETAIYSPSFSPYWFALQLATDGKIYFNSNSGTLRKLGRIENPNQMNTPGINLNAINFANNINPFYGLPNFFNIYFKKEGVNSYNTTYHICSGDSVIIGPQNIPGYQYSWMPDNSLSSFSVSQPLAFPADSRTYTLTSINQCNDTIASHITVHVKHSMLDIGNDTIICPNQTLLLNASQPKSDYIWTPGNYTTSSIVVTSPGTYNLTVIDQEIGCLSFDSLTILVYPQPSIVSAGHIDICENDYITVNLFSENNDLLAYVWVNDEPAHSVVVAEKGSYFIKTLDTNLCVNYDTIIVHFKECPLNFYVPKAFTPNEDGENDVFMPESIIELRGFNMRIYNRWGEIVFISQSQYKGWNGKYENKNSAEDVYIWKIEYEEPVGHLKAKTGILTLIR